MNTHSVGTSDQLGKLEKVDIREIWKNRSN
jgi:hypothetical protein